HFTFHQPWNIKTPYLGNGEKVVKANILATWLTYVAFKLLLFVFPHIFCLFVDTTILCIYKRLECDKHSGAEYNYKSI
uniref:Uncharacterized protein n=1 Tax=Leptobrachium leishanense TaxID=445787 RepID=A0A8C5WJ39_9ANUR